MMWTVDGKQYDLEEFAQHHPGGAVWLQRSRGRDISALVHTYHQYPSRVLPLLKHYKIASPKMNEIVPDSSVESQLFHFDEDPALLLYHARKAIQAPEIQTRIKQHNALSNAVMLSIMVLYIIAVQRLFIAGYVSWVPCMVFCRTALVGFGHYGCHKKKPNWIEALLEFNYVGSALDAFDKHVMSHHVAPVTIKDEKYRLWYGIRSISPLWRIPGYTLHRFGALLVGYFIVGTQYLWKGVPGIHERPIFWMSRTWLATEVFLCYYANTMHLFAIQFCCSLWYGTMLVFCSHLYETSDIKPVSWDPDWGAYQIKNSYEVTFSGNAYMDMLLSAGLSSHRVHHLFPWMETGFANVAIQDTIQRVCEEHGTPWGKPQFFWTERLPQQLYFLLTCPLINIKTSKPHSIGIYARISPVHVVKYIFDGFAGRL